MTATNDVPNEKHRVQVVIGDTSKVLRVPHGMILRDALLKAGISPYTAVTQRANCGGRGLCATCGVRIESGEPAPEHWHDRIGAAFGYPRLSCQVAVEDDMTVHILTDKLIWGAPDFNKRYTQK